MMLDHLELRDASARLRRAIYTTLGNSKLRTRDLGGEANTKTFTDGVIAEIGRGD